MYMLCGTSIKQKMRHTTSINSHSGKAFHICTLVIVRCPSPNSSQPSFYFFHSVTLDQKLCGGTCTTGSHTGQWEASLGAGNVTMKDNTSSQIILCVCG